MYLRLGRHFFFTLSLSPHFSSCVVYLFTLHVLYMHLVVSSLSSLHLQMLMEDENVGAFARTHSHCLLATLNTKAITTESHEKKWRRRRRSEQGKQKLYNGKCRRNAKKNINNSIWAPFNTIHFINGHCKRNTHRMMKSLMFVRLSCKNL